MQPLQYDLRCPAAKENSLTHTAASPSNLDAATTMRSAETELQNTIEIRATALKLQLQNRISTPKRKKDDFEALWKGIFKGKLLAQKLKNVLTNDYLDAPDAATPIRFTAFQLQKAIVLRMQPRHPATLTQPLHCDLQPKIQDTHRTTHTGTTTRCRTQRRNTFAAETTAAAPAAHTRYLSSPAAATLHGKTQAFVLLLPPQNKAHATFMQPLQCVSPHHVANLHGSTHMATPDDNNHAAIPLRSATTDSRHA